MSNATNLPAAAQSELIPIQNNDGAQAVLGRDLHAFLESKEPYTRWIARHIEKYGFVAGHDFLTKMSESTGGRPAEDHILSMDMAKELSMVQNNLRGKQAREYFIECEKRARAHRSPAELTRLELIKMAMEAEEERLALEARNKELEPRAGAWETFCGSSGDMSVADAAKALASRAGADIGRNRLFKEMQECGWVTHCHGYWEPLQYAVKRGYLAVKVNMPRWKPNGESFVPAPTVRVTPKGLDRLAGEFVAGGEVVA